MSEKVISLAKDTLHKHGPVAMMGLITLGMIGFVLWFVLTNLSARVSKLEDTVDYQSRQIDYSCGPAKPVR